MILKKLYGMLAQNFHLIYILEEKLTAILRIKLEKASLLNVFCHFVSVRHEFFSNRFTQPWNKLPNSAVEASSVDMFKARHEEGCYSPLGLRKISIVAFYYYYYY